MYARFIDNDLTKIIEKTYSQRNAINPFKINSVELNVIVIPMPEQIQNSTDSSM